MAILCMPLLLPQRDMTMGEFMAWLSQFDSDRDGRLSKDELEQALRSLNKWSAWWKARQGMKEADANRDGVIDRDEIQRLVDYARKHLDMKIYGAAK